MQSIITTKIGMASIIEDGAMLAVTLLSATPNTVTQVKTIDNDGYNAVQLGYGKSHNLALPQKAHFAKASASPKVTKEFRTKDSPEVTVGQKLTVEQFSVGDVVNATGISKGKGFAGGIKRWNFKRGRKTHGGRSYRRPGSIGSMYPQKIFKGKKMAGQLGHEQVTTRNLRVALVDLENNVIGVVGSVPGPKKGIVILKGVK